MSPRPLMGAGAEIGGARKADQRREPTDPPPVESETETRSRAAEVATFRTSRHQVGVPAMVLVAGISAVSAATIAWINKPPPPVVSPLSPDQQRALEGCARVAQDVAEIKAWTRWAEPQIGILLVRTDAKAYTPPPRTP